ncbi:MAG: DUF6580 family putative transport protein [Planctomycetota bacterium]
MDKREIIVRLAQWVTLVAVGVAGRLALVDLPNVAPVAALAMLAGFLGAGRPVWAVSVPLATMALSDLVIGGYGLAMMLVVYGALAAPAALGIGLRRAGRLTNNSSVWGDGAGVVGASLLSSLFFFVVTNFAVWLGSSTYAASWQGLAHCYTRAIPFFRYTLTGDLVFGSLLFGCYAVVLRLSQRWARGTDAALAASRVR